MFDFHFGQLKTKHNIEHILKENNQSCYLLISFKSDFFIEANGEKIVGKAGDLVLHAPGKRYAYGSLAKREDFINDWIIFSADSSESVFLRSLPYDIPISNGNIKDFSKYVSEILAENLRDDEFSPQLISNHIYQLLTILKRAENESYSFENKVHQEMHQLRLHIHKHCEEQWTLETMAKKSGYSVSHFCSLYKQLFEISPVDDLLNARLQKAKELLVLKNHKISEVANLCGFASIHYFSDFFKKKTGKSPSEY